jgi:methionine synthase II (cobalamin-independent)
MIPTEPIGSIPRPDLVQAIPGGGPHALPEPPCDEAVRDTIAGMEAAGAAVVCDGEPHRRDDFRPAARHGQRRAAAVPEGRG